MTRAPAAERAATTQELAPSGHCSSAQAAPLPAARALEEAEVRQRALARLHRAHRHGEAAVGVQAGRDKKVVNSGMVGSTYY
jgi:hypothetical protein